MSKTSNPFLAVSSNLKVKPFSTQELVCDKMGITEIKKGDLSYYPNLTALYIPGNKIKFLGNLETNIRLTFIDARKNEITDVDLKKQTYLRELLLSDNCMHDLDLQITKLLHLKNLEALDLRGNPMTLEKGYRLTVIAHIPWLKILDGLDVTPREKLKATMSLEEPIKSSTANFIHTKNKFILKQRSALATRSGNRPRSVLEALTQRPLSAADTIVKRKADDIRKRRKEEKARKIKEEGEFARLRSEAYAATALTDSVPLPDALDFLGKKERERKKREEKKARKSAIKRPHSRTYLVRPTYTKPTMMNDEEEFFHRLNPTLPKIINRVSNTVTYGK
jgi:hypothetical protein